MRTADVHETPAPTAQAPSRRNAPNDSMAGSGQPEPAPTEPQAPPCRPAILPLKIRLDRAYPWA